MGKPGNKKKPYGKKKIVYTMENSEDSYGSKVEETEALFMGLDTQASNSDSYVEVEVDLRVELVSAFEELEKCKKKNKQSSHIISELESQLLDAKRIEEDLNMQFNRRIQESDRFEKEIIQCKKNIDEGSIKSKFENSSRIIDDILNNQRSSSDRSGLGFNKEKKPECFFFTNQGGNKKIYVEALKSPVKKRESEKHALNSQDKNINNMVPKRPNKYLRIFLGHYYSCNNFVHKSLN